MAPSPVPRLSSDELRRHAREFLAKHHPKGTLPVPIEAIVEFQLGLDIVPVPGLCHGARGINGYLSSDRSSIYVDQGHFENVETRYHFTLAHEVGHLTLHSGFYQGFPDADAWRAFHAHLATHDLSWAEHQADTFAGLVLVPDVALAPTAEENFAILAERVREQYPDFDLASEAFWSIVADEVARRFGVHRVTARIRLENDRLWGRVL